MKIKGYATSDENKINFILDDLQNDILKQEDNLITEKAYYTLGFIDFAFITKVIDSQQRLYFINKLSQIVSDKMRLNNQLLFHTQVLSDLNKYDTIQKDEHKINDWKHDIKTIRNSMERNDNIIKPKNSNQELIKSKENKEYFDSMNR